MKTYQILALCVVLAVVLRPALACYSGTMLRSGGLSCFDKQIIVDLHNRLRQSVALGQVNGQPPAANMLQMSWDEELARQAQNWADRCTFQHDSNSGRRVSRFPVGQNLATTWTSPRPDTLGANPDFGTQINNWFNEVYRFGYQGSFTHSSGHYSQVIWGDTYLVGCGYSYYLQGNKYTKLYVCNYGPGGNVRGAPPYRIGNPSCSLYGTSPSSSYYGLCEVRTYLSNPCFYG